MSSQRSSSKSRAAAQDGNTVAINIASDDDVSSSEEERRALTKYGWTPPPGITLATLTQRHNGTVFTHPACLAGVPVEVITPEHPYWEPEWVDVPELIRPQLEAWQAKRIVVYNDPTTSAQQRSLATRQCNRGVSILEYFADPARELNIYQIVAKKYIQKSITQYDTIFRVVQILGEIPKFRNVDVTPLQWIRERLAQYIEVAPEPSKFSVSRALRELYHDPKLAWLRQTNGFRHVGRPTKPRDPNDPFKRRANGTPADSTPAASATAATPAAATNQAPASASRRPQSTAQGTPSKSASSSRAMGSKISAGENPSPASARTTMATPTNAATPTAGTASRKGKAAASTPTGAASSRKSKEPAPAPRRSGSQVRTRASGASMAQDTEGEDSGGEASDVAEAVRRNYRYISAETLKMAQKGFTAEEAVGILEAPHQANTHSQPAGKRNNGKATASGPATGGDNGGSETRGRAHRRRASIRDHPDMPKIPSRFNNPEFEAIWDDPIKRKEFLEKQDREEKEKRQWAKEQESGKLRGDPGSRSAASTYEEDFGSGAGRSTRSRSRGRSANPRKRPHEEDAATTPVAVKHRTKFHEKYEYDEVPSFDFVGYSDADSCSGGRITTRDYRLLQVRTKEYTTNPSVTQYWNWFGAPDYIFEHQVLEAVKPRVKWGKYNDELNFHLRLDEMVEIWFSANVDPETGEQCRKIKIKMRVVNTASHSNRSGTWWTENPDAAVEEDVPPTYNTTRTPALKTYRPKKGAKGKASEAENKNAEEELKGPVQLDAHGYPTSKGRGDVYAEFKRVRTMMRFVLQCSGVGIRVTRVPVYWITKEWDSLESPMLLSNESGSDSDDTGTSLGGKPEQKATGATTGEKAGESSAAGGAQEAAAPDVEMGHN